MIMRGEGGEEAEQRGRKKEAEVMRSAPVWIYSYSMENTGANTRVDATAISVARKL